MNKEVLSGVVLVAAALAAILIYNSPLAAVSAEFLRPPVVVGSGEAVLEKSLLHFIPRLSHGVP
ncbi:MAG: Na+/H+ antiporter NhaA, partial [Alphaproteobacteria bacterium]|nr:Na+/H+ antiporter NhaA [Alphaproteobacteria bacterium]